MIPRSSAPLTAPLRELEKRMLDSSAAIEHWFRTEWQDHTPPFYASVDLRNAGFKLAPVDTNLFPGGFNNLAAQFLPLAFDNCCTQPDHFANPDATPNRFYAYGVVARLALLAAAVELEETAPQE